MGPLIYSRLIRSVPSHRLLNAGTPGPINETSSYWVDFFTPVHPLDRLNPDFVKLITDEANSPARGIIEPMMRWYEDVDGNFVEQFQTTGFDQRIWELYLFATLVEVGFLFDRTHPMPDFVCNGLAGAFCAEAVTVGPTREKGAVVPPPPRTTAEEQRAYLKEYMPIKFGSPLYSKLGKRYWEREHVAGNPFVLAIADFSSPGSMTHTASALELYLYGYDHDVERDEEGRLAIKPRRIEEHRFGEKCVPSGFFRIPEILKAKQFDPKHYPFHACSNDPFRAERGGQGSRSVCLTGENWEPDTLEGIRDRASEFLEHLETSVD